MNPDLPTNRRKRKLTTAAILTAAVACGALATASLLDQKLYTPIGVLASSDSSPSFYIGISIYITIGTTLLTTALIRIGLDLSK